ncbi:MAG: DEAD/DEAH box helicase family protein [Muribaculaceae bacterium]|nr:DEAD/DEAH box helicase family protein [Muribaculaceae bacterium]
MTYKDIDIQACYESGTCDIVEDFYEPVLVSSVSYDRITGFFSSSALAIAARGLYGFIKNKGHMRLISSPILSSDDADIIRKVINTPEELTEDDLGINLSDLRNEFEENHISALGWMLKSGLLEIKLAVIINKNGGLCNFEEVKGNGLFHQKVGVLMDMEGNRISFSGSINETASAWVNNDEEFKVFKEWGNSHDYFVKDKTRFDEIWNGKRKNIKIFDLPSAIQNSLIKYSKDFDIEKISIKQYRKSKINMFNFENSPITLFGYQAEALNLWKGNTYRLLFEMATGTGKTRTAVAGIARVLATSKKVVVIISTPQNTLSKQWKENEIEMLNVIFDRSEIIDGTRRFWDKKLSDLLLENAAGFSNHVVIYTTHATSSSFKFTSIIEKELSKESVTLFVGDEVHWLGAKGLRRALLPRYDFRIGLSATPTRWFDNEGSVLIEKYFGNKKFVFSIHDALTEFNPLTGKHFLVNYYYYVSKVELNVDETIEYKKITQQLLSLKNKAELFPEVADRYERLLEQRANIIKNADAKYEALGKIIDDLNRKGRIENVIIFVSPQQINKVTEILIKKDVIFHKLTESQGTRPEKKYKGLSEREFIISKFKTGEYQTLIAIKCLDEGIDIPTANTGILMSSSTNPREYVQRIGRIIRQSEGKNFAYLYDICVGKITTLDNDEQKFENNIRKKEAMRLKEIAENAINTVDAIEVINSLSK